METFLFMYPWICTTLVWVPKLPVYILIFISISTIIVFGDFVYDHSPSLAYGYYKMVQLFAKKYAIKNVRIFFYYFSEDWLEFEFHNSLLVADYVAYYSIYATNSVHTYIFGLT